MFSKFQLLLLVLVLVLFCHCYGSSIFVMENEHYSMKSVALSMQDYLDIFFKCFSEQNTN